MATALLFFEMKKNLLFFFVIEILNITSSLSYAQTLSTMSKNLNSINCDSNIFWASRDNGGIWDVIQFELQNDSILFNNIISNNCPGEALGYSNNLNGNLFSPTFYSNNNSLSQNDIPYFYDSMSWQSSGVQDSFLLRNAGGQQNLIYYTGRHTSEFYTKNIITFNGSILDNIYNTPFNTSIAIPDIAVDANNNGWFFTLDDSNPFFATNLNVIDSNGNVIQVYNCHIETLNSYGLTIINNKLYIGYSSFDTINVNCIVEITLTVNSATTTKSILFPSGYQTLFWGDLASCNPGIPTGFKEIKKPTETIITLYPNPATDKITVGNIPANAKQLCITNSMGAVVWQQDLSPTPVLPDGEGVKNERQLVVNTSRFAPGMYAVCVKTNKEVLVKKMVKW